MLARCLTGTHSGHRDPHRTVRNVFHSPLSSPRLLQLSAKDLDLKFSVKL